MTRSRAPIALVTGASSGIGRSIAVALAGQGMRLYLTGRRMVELEATARMAPQGGPVAACYRADLTVESDIRALVASVASDTGGLDVLVHSAGMHAMGAMDSESPEDFDALYALNVRAPYLLTRLLLPTLRRRQGQVVFVNSSAGLEARAETGPYAASKHALRAIADALRAEVNQDGIRITTLYVGRTATPMQAALHAQEGIRYIPELLLQPEDVAAVAVNALTLPRSAEVTDIHVRPMRPPQSVITGRG